MGFANILSPVPTFLHHGHHRAIRWEKTWTGENENPASLEWDLVYERDSYPRATLSHCSAVLGSSPGVELGSKRREEQNLTPEQYT